MWFQTISLSTITIIFILYNIKEITFEINKYFKLKWHKIKVINTGKFVINFLILNQHKIGISYYESDAPVAIIYALKAIQLQGLRIPAKNWQLGQWKYWKWPPYCLTDAANSRYYCNTTNTAADITDTYFVNVIIRHQAELTIEVINYYLLN
jgi:hypothetical protein